MISHALRAGLYERVSYGNADTKLSRQVERQNVKGRQAAEQYGWRVSGRYADPAISASRFGRKDRPEWRRLLADIDAGLLDIVVLWVPSRGSRQVGDWDGFLELCRRHGVHIYLTQDRRLYDPSLTRDWKVLMDAGVDSAHESNEMSDRTKEGVVDSAARGDPYGRIPYGYMRRYEYDPARPKNRRAIQEPHPDESPVVAEIITRISKSEAVSALLRDFRDRDIRTRAGEHWSRSSLCRIVTNGLVYIGKRDFAGRRVDGNWPAIVDPDVFWKAHKILADPARRSQANKRGGIRPGAAKWLLSYVAVCEVCGVGLAVQVRPAGRRGKCSCTNCLSGLTEARTKSIPVGVHYYRCAASRASHAFAPVEWMDGIVADEVIRRCAEPDLYQRYSGADDRQAMAARDEADAERVRLAGFEEQAIAKKISPESFARIAAGIEARIAELEARANELAVPPVLSTLLSARDDPRYRTAARRLGILARWEEMPLAARRKVVQTLAAPTLRPVGPGGDPLDPDRVAVNFKA